MVRLVATHRVKNSDNETVGFIINNRFVNIDNVENNVDGVDNLTLLKSGTIRAKSELPVVRILDLNKQIFKKK